MIVAELAAKLGLVPDHASWDKGHELIESLHHALEAYLGYEGLKKVGELVEGTVEAAVQAKHLGEQLGTTAQAVQELGYAADVSGASAEAMQGAMRRLQLGITQAAHSASGDSPIQRGLTDLHMQLSDIKNLPVDQQLEKIADGFANAGPHVNKTAVAMELFGRQGAQLLPLLNKGAGGMAELREEARKLGVVIDEEGIEKAEKLEESQKRLKATLLGVRNEAVIAILPALTDMADGLGEWIQKNREVIEGGLEAVLKAVAFAFHLVGDAVSFVSFLYKEHQDVLIAIIAAVAILAADSVAAAVSSAIAWALAFLPITLAVAAIALLLLGMKKLIEYVVGRSVSFREIWEAFLEGGEGILDWLSDLPGRASQWIDETVDDIEKAFDELWANVVKEAHHAWDEIKGIPVIGHILRGAQFALSGSPLDAIKEAQANPAAYAQKPSFGLAGIGVTPGNGGVGDYQVSIGDTHISVDAAGGDPDEIASKVKEAVRDAHQDAIRQAYTNLTGGKR